ncbi:hypothetical protein GBAR_LOCUS7734 [Geodia barretti]|uniref:Uncharacterized protein n=1 Tax=Geodia barretti TaxID=519541 RepID=A0AA35RL21_GEOBA|nr:hypothetical protein GBAR_LOCUS7734 [Geodia barretti]
MLPCPAYLHDSECEDFGFDVTVESPKVTMSMLQICWPWSSRELQSRSLPARP